MQQHNLEMGLPPFPAHHERERTPFPDAYKEPVEAYPPAGSNWPVRRGYVVGWSQRNPGQSDTDRGLYIIVPRQDNPDKWRRYWYPRGRVRLLSKKT